LIEVASLREKTGFTLIQRREGKTSVAVTADINAKVTSNIEVEQIGRASCRERV